MALEIFANNERTLNSTRFYRLTSAAPYSVNLRANYYDDSTGNLLTDVQFLNKYSSVEYTFNWDTANKLPFFPTNPYVGINTTFIGSTPCVSSFQVYIQSSIPGVPSEVKSISAIFLDNIPDASTFVAYPSSYVVETQPPTQTFLNPINYTTSPGLSFYGEGHTENVLLSVGLPNATHKANWFVGNTINQINNQLRISKKGVLNSSTPTFSTSYVTLTSYSAEYSSIPLSLLITNGNIDINAPIVTYPDSGGGVAEFYKYFSSSRKLDESLDSSNTKLKNDIQIYPYPIPYPTYGYTSPFPASKAFNLPLDYANRGFRSVAYPLPYTSFLLTHYKGSNWELDAKSSAGQWVYPTGFLPQITAYQFKLGYDKVSVIPPFFKASALYNTTVFLNVSTTESFLLSTATAKDWKPRTVTRPLTSDPALIYALPFVKIFTPNYYNLKNYPVSLTNVSVVQETSMIVNKIELFSDSLSSSIVLTGSKLNEPFFAEFTKTGVVNLSAVVTFTTLRNNISKQVPINLPNFIEVVEKYDDIQPLYYQTKNTELALTQKEAPLLTPNEWVTADNVNSVIKKLYTTLQQLIYKSFYYRPRYKFYGWLGSSKMINEVIPVVTENPIYTWQDLKCSIPGTTIGYTVSSEGSWVQQDCSRTRAVLPAFDIKWLEHKCNLRDCDPSCFQKYCTEWNWTARKRLNSTLTTTWNNTKRKQKYQKTWKYEKCELDSQPINCDDKGKWYLSNIDPEWFPIPTCVTKRRFFYKGIVVLPDEKFVLANDNEINLVANDYQATLLGRRGIADDLYSFQQIENIAVNSKGLVYVLDSKIPRVTIYEIANNKFKLYSYWGTFGFVNNPTGFNKPKDIHIDANDYVWVVDTGNQCIKKYTSIGNHITTIKSESFGSESPLSVCVDSLNRLHVLTQTKVYVCDVKGNLEFYYDLPSTILNPNKINTSFNKETIYVSFETGVVKFFSNGNLSHFVVNESKCRDGKIISNYSSMVQDKYRNLFVIVEDKVFKYGELMELVEGKSTLNPNIFWDLQNILVHREEYVQPWVYLKSFHRLWDNIELLRSSLFYDISGCRSFASPKYLKQDLVIGQNEIVVNSVINRMSTQLWENLKLMFDYFDPACSNKATRQISSSSILNPIKVVANVSPGSTIIDYVAIATYPMDKPVDVMFTHSLGTSSLPLVVAPTITIPQNKLTGNVMLSSSQLYSTLTQTCSFTNSTATITRGKSTKYKFVVDCSCTFA